MNMKEVNVFKGFYYKNRANATFATKVKVFISKDNKNWTDMGQYALGSSSQTTAQNAAMKEFAFSNLVEAQYVKFVFPDPNTGGAVHVAIAELGVFYDI
ncbi:F5/8 type C domain protein [compost metagenome]